MSLNVYTATKL